MSVLNNVTCMGERVPLASTTDRASDRTVEKQAAAFSRMNLTRGSASRSPALQLP